MYRTPCSIVLKPIIVYSRIKSSNQIAAPIDIESCIKLKKNAFVIIRDNDLTETYVCFYCKVLFYFYRIQFTDGHVIFYSLSHKAIVQCKNDFFFVQNYSYFNLTECFFFKWSADF